MIDYNADVQTIKDRRESVSWPLCALCGKEIYLRGGGFVSWPGGQVVHYDCLPPEERELADWGEEDDKYEYD